MADLDEPTTYKEAIASDSAEAPHWIGAVDSEVESLLKNETWIVVRRDKNMNVIGTKWVFKKKKDEYGNVKKYKARLVAKGFHQRKDIDYHETFAPVLRTKSLRLILALSTLRPHTQLTQIDVKTAFLNADVTEDVYVEVPEGIDAPDGHVLKLRKALYGIKQAPHAWNKHIDAFFKSLGFTACVKDTCIYILKIERSNGIYHIIIGLFVDDMIIMCDKEVANEWDAMKQRLMKQYEMTDLGTVNHILGLHVKQSNNNQTLTIDQQTYVLNKMTEFGMQDCKPVDTPSTLVKLQQEGSADASHDITAYRELVGSLMYAAAATRPDIMHSTNICTRFMRAPQKPHLVAAKRVLRYLNGTTNEGLIYTTTTASTGRQAMSIVAYCDADWGGDLDDRKSTTGYCVFVNNNLISWNTKKQATVALSSAEAELMSVSDVVKEIMWLRFILKELGYTVVKPTIVHCDNKSAIQIARNDTHHDRTKHIDIRYHFIHDSINNKIITLQWIASSEQLADIFTKATGPLVFHKHKNKLMYKVRH